MSVLKEHFHTDTTTLIHDLTFDIFTFKGIILKQLIQGIAFIEYTSCQMTKELSYGSEYNIRKEDLFIVFGFLDMNWQRTCIPRHCAQLTVLYASD